MMPTARRLRGPVPHAFPAAPRGQELPRPAAGGVWPSVGAVAPSLCGHRTSFLTPLRPLRHRQRLPSPTLGAALSARNTTLSRGVRARDLGARSRKLPPTSPPRVRRRSPCQFCAGSDNRAARAVPRQLLRARAAAIEPVGSAQARGPLSLLHLEEACPVSWTRHSPTYLRPRVPLWGVGVRGRGAEGPDSGGLPTHTHPRCRESGRAA